jgi:hypothetical protein
MINITTGRRGSFLAARMSYLKFHVTNTATVAGHIIAADFNIASIFSRLELYNGSNLLEQTHEHGILVNIWHDICGILAAFGSTGNLLEGKSAGTTNPRRTGEVISIFGKGKGARGGEVECAESGNEGIYGTTHARNGLIERQHTRAPLDLPTARVITHFRLYISRCFS